MNNPYNPSKAKPLSEEPIHIRGWHAMASMLLVLFSGLFGFAQLVSIFTDFGSLERGKISLVFYLYKFIFLAIAVACCVFLAKNSKNSLWAFVALAISMIIFAYAFGYTNIFVVLYLVFGCAFSRYATRVGLYR